MQGFVIFLDFFQSQRYFVCSYKYVCGLGELAVLNGYMLSIKKMISYFCNRALEPHRQHALFQFPVFQGR